MFRNKEQNVFTDKVNKTALSVEDNKRLPTFYGVIPYRHGIGAGRACKAELIEYIKMKN